MLPQIKNTPNSFTAINEIIFELIDRLSKLKTKPYNTGKINIPRAKVYLIIVSFLRSFFPLKLPHSFIFITDKSKHI